MTGRRLFACGVDARGAAMMNELLDVLDHVDTEGAARAFSAGADSPEGSSAADRRRKA